MKRSVRIDVAELPHAAVDRAATGGVSGRHSPARNTVQGDKRPARKPKDIG
jgi:hypothetical protein